MTEAKMIAALTALTARNAEKAATRNAAALRIKGALEDTLASGDYLPTTARAVEGFSPDASDMLADNWGGRLVMTERNETFVYGFIYCTAHFALDDAEKLSLLEASAYRAQFKPLGDVVIDGGKLTVPQASRIITSKEKDNSAYAQLTAISAKAPRKPSTAGMSKLADMLNSEGKPKKSRAPRKAKPAQAE